VKRKPPFLLLLLALLACAVPQAPGAAPSLPTGTPLAVVTATPAASAAPAGQAATPTPHPSATPRPSEHRIGIRRVYGLGEFYDRLSGTRFTPRGVVYENIIPGAGGYQDRLFGVGIYDSAQVQADFERLQAAGYNTVRLQALEIGLHGGAECLLQANGTLNPAYLDNIADAMRQAQQHDLALLLASAGLPDPDGYAGISLPAGEDSPYAAGRNAEILSAEGVEASRRYWGDLLAGLAERGAPFESVLGWELLDEFWVSADLPPFTLTGTLTTTLGQAYAMDDPAQRQLFIADSTRHYVAQLRQAVLAVDSGALLGMGFLRPDFPNPARFNDYRYADTASLLESAALDFFDLHVSPGGDLDLAQAAQNFGLSAQNTRPILLGQAGAALETYPNALAAASALQAWTTSFCAYGVDGWLYASYRRSPQNLAGGVWGFADVRHLLQARRSTSPTPAPWLTCRPPTWPLPGRLGWPSCPPSALAVDGSPAAWQPGAPPPQWLEIDLGAPGIVASLRLAAVPPAPPTIPEAPAVVTPAPSLSGPGLYQVWVAGPDGELRLAYEFNGPPPESGVFELTFDPPLSGVQYLRIITEAAVSLAGRKWKSTRRPGPNKLNIPYECAFCTPVI
jgi:hypothetical protein